MLFDPISTKNNSFSSEMISYWLSEETDVNSPVGNFARHDISNYLYGCLVGLSYELNAVIPRALTRLKEGISKHEELWFGTSPPFHAMALHISLALVLWIKDSINSKENWEKARLFDVAAVLEAEAYHKSSLGKDRLDDYMALCFQAEQYELGIAEFEKYHGVKKISLKRKLPPRDFGYALCLHYSRGEFDADEIFAAGRTMIQSKLEDDWLGYGQSIRAAIWLKVVYWHRDSKLTPLEVILKAYENMPNVLHPDFV